MKNTKIKSCNGCFAYLYSHECGQSFGACMLGFETEILSKELWKPFWNTSGILAGIIIKKPKNGKCAKPRTARLFNKLAMAQFDARDSKNGIIKCKK